MQPLPLNSPSRWRMRSYFVALITTVVVSCGGGGSDAATTQDAATTPDAVKPQNTGTNGNPPLLQMPRQGLTAAELAVVVAQGDPTSEAIATYYQARRNIPAANIVRVTLPTTADSISAADFARLKAEIEAKLPAGAQATLLTWSAPSRVTGSCTMSITSAMAFGFDARYCGAGCAVTAASAYFDSESAKPYTDHGIRPSMMLGASSFASAKSLIDRGASADASYPAGDAYLVRTNDAARSVRYPEYASLAAQWNRAGGLRTQVIDNSGGTAANTLVNQSNVLFYFTGLISVANIASNTFRAGAAADHLTSFGGYLPGGNGQMPITAWLEGGATASYGTVEEPCNYPQKFSMASVLMDHYYRGSTLLEAYWKSVQWPGQGLFVGEPLAQPFRNVPTFSVSGGQYVVTTRGLRAGSNYSVDYRIAPSAVWFRLASFVVQQPQPGTFSAPLPPAGATHIRLVGPCPTNSNQQCTLSTSG